MRRVEDRGSVTVYAVLAGFVLSLGALVGSQVIALIVLQHQVSAAADLSAIAASQAAVQGRDGCAAAGKIAHQNQVELVSCTMAEEVATVTTRGASQEFWGQRFAFERKARAAPRDYLQSR